MVAERGSSGRPRKDAPSQTMAYITEEQFNRAMQQMREEMGKAMDQMMNQALDGIGAKVRELQQEVAQMVNYKDDLEDLKTQVEELARKASGVGLRGGAYGSKEISITDQKGFNTVPNYTGKPGEHEDWAFKFKDFLENVDSRYIELLELIKTDLDDVTNAESARERMATWDVDGIDWLDDQLYHALAQKVQGTTLATVKNLQREKGVRGTVAWRRLNQDALGQNQVRTHELSKRVLQPSRVRDFASLLPAFEQWEMWLNELQQVAGEGEEIPEIIQIAALRALIPQELEDDLRKFGREHVSSYPKLKGYVLAQNRERKEPYFEASGNGGGQAAKAAMLTQSGAESEDCALCDGGGEVNGIFSGTCHACGGWGHRLNQCPTRDAERQAKGQGKDGKGAGGKGDSKGKGGYGPYASSPAKGDWGYSEKRGSPWNQGGGTGSWKGDMKGKGYGKTGGWRSGGQPGYGGKAKGKGWPTYGLEAGFPEEPYICAVHCSRSANPSVAAGPTVTTSNRYDALQELDVPELSEENCWPTVRESVTEPAKAKKESLQPMPKNKSQKVSAFGTSVGAVTGFWTSLQKPEAPVIGYFGMGTSNESLNTVGRSDEWVQVSAIVDSGAAACVAPKTFAPQVAVCETEASKRGSCFYAANGDEIPNLGEKHVPMITAEGQAVRMKYQVADVVRPLCSVSAICDRDNTVVFGKAGGYIWDNSSGQSTYFPRVNGVYELKTWMHNPTAGFSGRES